MKKNVISIFILTLVLGSAFYYQQKSTRAPSSIDTHPTNTLLNIDAGLADGQVKKDIKKALLKTWDWHLSAHSFHLRLENLQLQSSTFCEVYPNISLILEAPEVSYSGEHPEVSMTKTCEVLNGFVDYSFDLGFLIDPEAMKNYQTRSSPTSEIRLSNWENEIQKKWRLKQIVFYPLSGETNQTLVLTGYEILSVLGYSIDIRFD